MKKEKNELPAKLDIENMTDQEVIDFLEQGAKKNRKHYKIAKPPVRERETA